MKCLLSVLVGLFVFASANFSFGQSIPAGLYSSQAYHVPLNGGSRMVNAQWLTYTNAALHDTTVTARFNSSNKLVDLIVYVAQGPKAGFYGIGVPQVTNFFSHEKEWKEFVQGLYEQYEFLEIFQQKYFVDKKPWKFVGCEYEAVRADFPSNVIKLYFERQGRRISVEEKKWRGNIPKPNEEVFVARWEEQFYLTEWSDLGYLPSGAMTNDMVTRKKALNQAVLSESARN